MPTGKHTNNIAPRRGAGTSPFPPLSEPAAEGSGLLSELQLSLAHGVRLPALPTSPGTRGSVLALSPNALLHHPAFYYSLSTISNFAPTTLRALSPSKPVTPAPTARPNAAQGSALGLTHHTHQALKGHPTLSRGIALGNTTPILRTRTSPHTPISLLNSHFPAAPLKFLTSHFSLLTSSPPFCKEKHPTSSTTSSAPSCSRHSPDTPSTPLG